MSNVVDLDVVTTLDFPPDRVLRRALEAGLTEVVVVGLDADGNSYFRSSVADAAQAGWHLRRAEWRLMQTIDELESGE